MTRHETHVRYDIAESGILPLSTNDLLAVRARAERARRPLETLLALPLGYSEARGTEELRGRLAATYARGDADHILVTTGAIEANFLLFNVLLDAGRSRHRAVSGVSAALQRAARDRLRRVAVARRAGDRAIATTWTRSSGCITPKTRVIVVNTPHNPTGAMLPPDDGAARLRAGRVGRRDGHRRRGVSLARRAGRRAVRAADVRSGAARHQRRHAVEAVRAAGSAHRLDRRRRPISCSAAGPCATTSRSVPGKLNDALALPRDDAPRSDRRAQPAHHRGEPGDRAGVDGRARGVPRRGRRRAAACWRCSSTTCRSTRSSSPTSSRPSTA